MSGFARNVFSLGSGNVAAQLISILTVPVITRLYSPGEFGAFALVLSLVALLFPMATLRLNAAILLPKDDDTARRLLVLSIGAVVLSSLVVTPALALALHRWAPLDSAARSILWFLVAGVLVHGLVHCVEFWLLRLGRYRIMATGYVGEAVTDRLSAIVLGLGLQAGAIWLAFSRLMGAAVHLGILVYPLVRARSRVAADSQARPRAYVATLGEYRRFPLFSTWAFLCSGGGRELPTVVLAGMFSPSIAGLYALGVRVLGFPMMMVGDAIAKVFFRQATEMADRPERLTEVTRLLVRGAVYLMFPPMFAVCVLGPAIFEIAFGAEWRTAGEFAQVLAMAFLVTFVYRVVGIFFDLFNRQEMRLVFDGAHLALTLLALGIGGLRWGVEGAVWGLLLATLVVHGSAVIYLLGRIGMSATDVSRLLWHCAVNLSPFAAAVVAAQILGPSEPVAWLVGLALVGVQALWLARRDAGLTSYVRGIGR